MSAWTVEGLEAEQGGFRLGPLDFRVGPGETVAVLGESGAGKTTLLRTLAGLQGARGGRILRGGEEVTAEPVERRGAVYVPQGLALFPDRSVARNVAYPFEIGRVAGDETAVTTILERFRLTPLAQRRPSTLSAGEQQRVALARALAARPELLLWDEPWGALDIVSRDTLLATLAEIRAAHDLPLLFVTHDPSLALTLSDRWMLLEEGRLRALARPSAIVARPPTRFAARFAGYENVYGPTETARAPARSLRAVLAEAGGRTGAAVGLPRARPPREGTFVAVVEHLDPSPEGPRVTAHCDGLRVRLRWETGDPSDLPRPGESVSFDLEGVRIAPLGEDVPTGEAGYP